MKTNLLLLICFAFLLNGAFAQTAPQDTTSVAQDTTQQNEDESGYIEITLTDEELAKVDSLVSFLSADEISGFQSHFDLWLESTQVPEIQIHSNPEYYKTEEFYEFKNYSLELGKAYIGLIIKCYQEHHEVSHFILLDIIRDDYSHLINEVRTELKANQYTEEGDTVYYKNPNYSFANLYFKKILELIQVTKSELIISSSEEMRNNSVELSVYPNPAQYQFTVSFKLTERGYPSLKIYNLTGKIVEVLKTNEFYPDGTHPIQMKAQLKSGIYLVVLETKNSKSIKKLIVN